MLKNLIVMFIYHEQNLGAQTLRIITNKNSYLFAKLKATNIIK